MLKVVAEMGVLSGGESREEYQRRECEERRERLGEKVLHERFFRGVKEVALERSWEWMRAGIWRRVVRCICVRRRMVRVED